MWFLIQFSISGNSAFNFYIKWFIQFFPKIAFPTIKNEQLSPTEREKRMCLKKKALLVKQLLSYNSIEGLQKNKTPSCSADINENLCRDGGMWSLLDSHITTHIVISRLRVDKFLFSKICLSSVKFSSCVYFCFTFEYFIGLIDISIISYFVKFVFIYKLWSWN